MSTYLSSGLVRSSAMAATGSYQSQVRKLAAAVATAALVAIAPSAFAGAGDPIVPSVNPWLSVNSSGDLLPSNDNNDGSNEFSYTGTSTTSGQFAVNWDLVVNPDPYITGALTITNLSTSALNFTVSLMLPVTPAFSSGLMGGSIDATVFDHNNNGTATLRPQTNDSTPIYFGRIDGVNELLMFAQVVTCGGAGCSGNSGESQMPPSIPVTNIDTNIGTQLKFNLSAGDRVTFATHFEVLPVPVPGAAWLMGSALLGLVGARRRK